MEHSVLDPRGKSFTDITGRILVGRGAWQGRTAVLLIFGQSNAANAGSTPYTPRLPVFNFNIFDGKCYVAQDPLLGPTERQGSFACRLGDMLIEHGIYDAAVLVPIAAGGSAIEEWTPRGRYYRRLKAAIERAKLFGLIFTHALWHQGETDAKYNPDSAHYRACFGEIRESLRNFGVAIPIFVAQATLSEGRTNESIRAAQRALVDASLGVFAGPDTDVIDASDRFDGCHMAESGLIKHAAMWFDCLTRIDDQPGTAGAQGRGSAAVAPR